MPVQVRFDRGTDRVDTPFFYFHFLTFSDFQDGKAYLFSDHLSEMDMIFSDLFNSISRFLKWTVPLESLF